MRAIWLPRPGFHITKSDAKIAGQALEALRAELGRMETTVEEFEAFCRRPKEPVHAVWLRKRAEIAKVAGLQAAGYLLRAIEMVTISGGAPRRATVILRSTDKEPAPGQVYAPTTVEHSVDLMRQAEEEFVIRVRGLARSFADIAGEKRTSLVLQGVAAEFTEKLKQVK